MRNIIQPAILGAILLTGCGLPPKDSSEVKGLPSEGDSVIASLHEEFKRAQVIDSPFLVRHISNRTYRCEAFDARSYGERDHGVNNLAFSLRFIRSGSGTLKARYDWQSGGRYQTSTVSAALEQAGLGIPGSTVGYCLGSRTVAMVRRDFQDHLIVENVWINSCSNTGDHKKVDPVSRPGFSVLAYWRCRS